MAKFKVGDKVRLSKFNSCENVHWITEKLPYVGTVGFITHCYEEGSYLIMLHDGLRMIWPASALALVNDYDAAVAECRAAIDRAEAAEAEVERLRSQLFERNEELLTVTTERDGLQARIDAGRKVVSTDNCWWTLNSKHPGAHTAALLIDRQPIKPQWTRADGSVNERQGERRKGREIRCQCAECDFHPHGRKFKTCTTHHFKDNRRDPSGANDRRKCKA